MQLWMNWMQDLARQGHLKDRGQPLEPTGKVVAGKEKAITDGPFAEAKDLVGGYTLFRRRISRGGGALEGMPDLRRAAARSKCVRS